MGFTLFDWHKFNKAAPLVIDDGNRNRCWFYALSFFFLMFCIVFCWQGYEGHLHKRYLETTGVLVTEEKWEAYKIHKLAVFRDRKQHLYNFYKGTYAYEVDGETYFCREEKELHRLPDTLPVYYDPKNPAASTLKLTEPLTFSEWLRAFALLAVIGFFGVLNYRRMKAKEAKQFVFQR